MSDSLMSYADSIYPAGNYMFKVNNRNSRTRCELWTVFKVNNKDTRTTPWRRSGVFIDNFETYFTPCSSVYIEHCSYNFKCAIVSCVHPVSGRFL